MTAAGAAGLGDLVYVGSGVGYPLQVFDVSDLDVPQKVAAVPGDLAGGGVALSDTLLCQLVHDPDGDSRRWLDLYSVADPRQPRSLGRGEIGAYARYLAATEGVAYAAGYYDIHVMDLSDPAHPQNVKSLNPPGSGAMRAIMVEGQFLYAACNSSGLVIYDLADPLDPYLAATVPLAACQAAAVQGDLCIAVDWYRGLCTIDVSDPAVPVILHEETLEQVATWTAALDGGHFLLVNEFAEGWIYDVTDPLAPQLQGGFDAIALPWTVTVAGRWLAMAHGTQGLQLAWRACPVTVAVPPETPAATPRLAVAPNPFNPRTTITFSIVRAGEVAVSVHDLAGRRVARLVDGWRAEGTHAVGWNGRDEDGGGVPSGAYLVRLRTADGVRSVKMMLVR
jgi:hypothetical protein